MLGGQWRIRELAASVTLMWLAAAMLLPALAVSRESARRRQCIENLRHIGHALRAYHDVQGSFPPAAVWRQGKLKTALLMELKRVDLITYENWAMMILSHLDEQDLAERFDLASPVLSSANKEPRSRRLPEFSCASDIFNRDDNCYAFQPSTAATPIAQAARGNYAINGGSHNPRYTTDNAAHPHGESLFLRYGAGTFGFVGSGVAGINRAVRLPECKNGQATLVAVDEVRAGVHPLDPRGIWALGQIGGSITWGHGIAGDDYGPNNSWPQADDILGCARLHAAVGSKRLLELGMPCVEYIDRNDQATARSMHPKGAHVLFVDGAARFVSDDVDRGLWHVMHSRETPPEALDDIKTALAVSETPPDAPSPHRCLVEPTPGAALENSLGMRFMALPAGTFRMGVPDVGNEPAPPECPPHEIRLRRAFCMGTHEVTQAQYQPVMGSNPSRHLPEATGTESTDDFPVENVTWHEADEFCRRLGEMPDENSAKRRYRLPTEAEWEYACRSGKSEPYHWNPHRQANDKSGDAAGIEPPLPLTKVGSYPANAFGLFDMRGNVWEWCADWFDRTYYSRSPVEDPQGPAKGYLKVVRGGDWIFVGEPCHINYPIMSPWRRSPFVGFRVVCEVED